MAAISKWRRNLKIGELWFLANVRIYMSIKFQQDPMKTVEVIKEIGNTDIFRPILQFSKWPPSTSGRI